MPRHAAAYPSGNYLILRGAWADVVLGHFRRGSLRGHFLVCNDLVHVPNHPFNALGSGLATVAPVGNKQA